MNKEQRYESQVVAKTGIKKEAGYLYFLQCKECSQNRFVSKKCRDPEKHFFEIWRKKMSIGFKKEKVCEAGIHCEKSYNYYINKDGDIARFLKAENTEDKDSELK